MDKDISLTAGPISRGLIQLAIPILCASILQTLNVTVSAFWVGRVLGEAALAAITNAQSLMALLTGTSFGIAMAATILVGQRIGVDDICGAKRVVGTGVIFLSTLAIALTVLGLALAEPLLMMMRTAPEALKLALPYIRVMLLALPSMYLLAFVMSLLLGVGDSKTPLKFVLLSVSLGATLTPVLVLGGEAIGGIGVVGAALAVFVAQVLCLVALLRYLYRRGHPLIITRSDASSLRFDWSIARELVGKGIPMGAQVLVVSLSSVLMVALVNRFGVDTTAAYGALLQLWAYILMPALAMGAAVSTVAAQNVGARNWVRVKRTTQLGLAYSFAMTAAIVTIVYAADSAPYRPFLPSGSPALEIARHVNGIVTWSLAFMCIPSVLFGVMRAAGAVMFPLLVHILSLLVVRYPLAALLMDRWQADAIWWSLTISAMVDVLLASLYYRYGGWNRTSESSVAKRLID